MQGRRVLLLMLLFQFLLLSVAPRVRGEGLLEDVRGEVRDSSDDSGGNHGGCDDDFDDDSSFFSSLFGPLFDACGPFIFYTVTSLWWVPHLAIEGDSPMSTDFPPAPYWNDHDGFLALMEPFPDQSKGWSVRLSEDYGSNLGGLSKIGTRLVADSTKRLGIDTEWDHWIERVPGGHDSLDTGDFNFVFRFAQSEKIQMHSGLGFNWLADLAGSDFGFNFTYGLDYFPAKPWVISTTMDAGTLGHAGLFHLRTTAGFMIRRTEVFTGFDYQQIGHANLYGLLAGLRLWF